MIVANFTTNRSTMGNACIAHLKLGELLETPRVSYNLGAISSLA